jgi:Transposase DDE domain/Insertion element 4 transposase N-terminal
LSRHFAMRVQSPQVGPAAVAGSAAEDDDERGLREGLAARVASGPGLWLEELKGLDRGGLLEQLLGEGIISEAVAAAPHGHKLDRVLTAKNTLLSVLAGCLFAGQGYDQVLRTVFAMPGLGPVAPGTPVPTGPALSKGRARSGEHVARRAFELDAARTDAELGIGQLWHGMEVTAYDGTTAELDGNSELAAAFGVPSGGKHPMLRIVALTRTATHRWAAAAAGGYHDGENALADELVSALSPGMINLADRGFFSMNRFLRSSATGAQLCWRIKNGAKSVPLRKLETLPDGSELVMLHESGGMRSRRRRDTGDPAAARLPDTIARLVQFTIVTRTRGGRAKTSTIRLLTTLLDHEEHPAREIAVLHAERWQIEIAFLHLKKTLRGARRVLRGKSEILARQEAWAFLLVHNMIAAAAARAAALAGIDPDLIPFTAVLGLVRAGIQADTRCGHCGKLPADPLGQLTSDITAYPRHRPGRTRTSGRTAAERRSRPTEEVTYTITITPSNLPPWQQTP